jgi:hypothetical protein
MFRLDGADSLGGVLSGTITTDASGVVTNADVFDTGAINAFNAQTGTDEYTLINFPTLPNTGTSFGLTSSLSTPDGGTTLSYFADNLWFVVDAPLDGSVAVVNLIPVGSFLGDPNGSVREDIYGDPFSLKGTFTQIPEPASLALLGLGGLVVIARRRLRA